MSKNQRGIWNWKITHYVSHLDSELSRTPKMEGLKASNYRRRWKNEDLDMYYRVQLTNRKIEYVLGYVYTEPKTEN